MFGSIAFCSYGCFWISLCITLTLPTTRVSPPDENAMGCYMMIWGVFSFGMWVATLKRAPWALSFLFLTVWLLFLLLAIHFFDNNAHALKAAGIEGSICGLLAIYIAFAEILNETYSTTILPICARDVK
jgi:succinate-acetate transporter protein